MRKHLHFHGKYMGDMRSVFHIVQELGEHDISYRLQGLGEEGSPDGADYILTSHKMPKEMCGRNVHLRHGCGLLPVIPDREASRKEFMFDYAKFHAIRVLNEEERELLVQYGYPKERTMLMGMPFSIDLMAHVDANERVRFLTMKGQDPSKSTVLYAPSWGQGEERGFFVDWFQDGKEEARVRKFCEYVCRDLKCNLIVRMHERHRYSEDWLAKYDAIFRLFRVYAIYLDDDPDNLPYLRHSDVMVGDLSAINVYYYVMDKPVVHVGVRPFSKKINKGCGGMSYTGRAGHVAGHFDGILDSIADSLENPMRFSPQRKAVVEKGFSCIGEESRQAVIREVRRICV